jgi:hypothetical protein
MTPTNNIQVLADEWAGQLKADPSFTQEDAEELKSHLIDLCEELRAKGLSEEEAFWVASHRIGDFSSMKSEFEVVNNPTIQMRKSLIILAGVLAYFLLYYFLLFSSKLLLIILLASGAEAFTAIRWVIRYLGGAHVLFMIFALSIYFFENKTIEWIEKIKLIPKHTVYLLVTAIVFCILDTCSRPISKNLIKKVGLIEGRFYDIYFYFDYSFPLLICTSFVVLYFRYFRKVKF